jgi:predicted DNA-binding transcriptional regulator AlpA
MTENEIRAREKRGSHFRLPTDLEKHRVLPARAAAALCGYSYDHFLDMAREGKVPAPIRFNARKYGWKAGVLLDWLDERAKPAAA